MTDRLSVAQLLRMLGIDRVEDLDDTLRWLLIELWLRRTEERERVIAEWEHTWVP